VIAKAAELKPERFREPVAAQAERLRINLKLTTLNLALPAPTPEWRSPQPAELFRLLAEFEMRGTLAEAQKRYSHISPVPVPAAPPAPPTATQGELF